MSQEEIDLDELRKIVLRSQEFERTRQGGTRLLEDENPNRRKVKKINPKFCEEWERLDLDFKVNRLIEYVSRFAEENDLSNSTAKKVRKLLVNALINESLQVEYDSIVGIVINIPKLYYNDSQGYYLGTYLNDDGKFIFRVSKISKCINSSDQKMSITTEDYQNNNSNDSSNNDSNNRKSLNLTLK